MAMVALQLAAAGAHPSSMEAADAYVRGIYRAIPAERFDYRTVRYAGELANLMARDTAFSKASGDVGAIDAVPFCECQDNDPNYAVLATRTAAHGPDRATVAVTLRNGAIQHFAVDLALRRGQWRVADVHGRETTSLLALLRREVPRNEASLRHHAIH